MEWLAIALIIVGIVLLVAEIFIPSFGITGALGTVLILIGVIITADTFMTGLIIFAIVIVIAMILMIIAYRLVATNGSPFVLTEKLHEDNTYNLEYFKGKKGVAMTPLRPSGTGDFDGVRLDVLTQGEFIEKGTTIYVNNVAGKRIFVRKV